MSPDLDGRQHRNTWSDPGDAAAAGVTTWGWWGIGPSSGTPGPTFKDIPAVGHMCGTVSVRVRVCTHIACYVHLCGHTCTRSMCYIARVHT